MTLVKIIDVHPGRHCREGGQYGYWRLVPIVGGRVIHGSTAQWGYLRDEFCTRCGQFHRGECTAEPTEMTSQDVEDVLRRYPARLPHPWEADGGVTVVVDATGHTHVPDGYGGCAVCYP